MKLPNIKPILSKDFFLLLLPLFFVFHGYVENHPLIDFNTTCVLFITYFSAFLSLNAVVFFIVKEWKKSSIYTLILMLCFFFFGSLHDFIKHIAHDSSVSKYSFVLPFLTIIVITAFLYVRKTQANFQSFKTYLNCLLIILILFDSAQLLFKTNGSSGSSGLSSNDQKCDTCSTPDIYFIIADEYIGKQVLKDKFQFDNSAFENELSKRNFHIIENSTSNYNYTPYSIASILSMDYLPNITQKSNDLANRRISYSHIDKNLLTKTLTAYGYTFHNHSIFDFAGKPTEVNTMFFKTKDHLITGQTLLGRINRDLRFHLVTKLKLSSEIRKGTYKTLENNVKLIDDTYQLASQESSSPRFVYIHLMMPHYPYFYDRSGNNYPLEQVVEGCQVNKKHYIEYLQYCNTKFLKLIDHILSSSRTPPIIIFMGDHGFRHFTEPVEEKYEFLNFSSVYLPRRNYTAFYSGMSAVNLFRVLLNTQFNQRLPLLRDSTILMREY